jgi:rhamnose utilization protein RhaD (predicted bifunctional aldolase and dehydrogenase)
MSKNLSTTNQAKLTPLRELSARIGSNPLLTQASIGNTSIKLQGILWIKASGKWMADAIREDILIPVDLAEVRQCVKQKVDPAARFTSASIETAMHAVLPHRVVLHVHCVNTIAWAVRKDARVQLEHQLDGLRWQWISYVPSGLPLAREIEKVLSVAVDTNVLVLGNHGLVIGGEDCSAVEALLSEVGRRLAIYPRRAHRPNYDALSEMTDGSGWALPDDEEVHALGTDAISGAVLSGGFLYPCQSIFSNASTPGLFRSVHFPNARDLGESRFCTRPFLIIEGYGVIVRRTITLAQRALMNGLAQVVQRIGSSTPLRYLSEEEVANSSSTIASRYRELADVSRYSSAR